MIGTALKNTILFLLIILLLNALLGNVIADKLKNNLNINIKGKDRVVKSLNGFIDAYNFYIKQIES